MNNSIVYALDFDGVICDSAIETGISGWKAAQQIWNDMIESFRQLRPIIETGYEAILTMRLLFLGESVDSLYSGCADKFQKLIQEAHVDTAFLKRLFGETRDIWISHDKTEWIQKNPLYPGVAEKLIQLGNAHTWYVVTTKQERFVKMIFTANQIELTDDCIFGLDRNLSKNEILKMLLKRHPQQPLHFVEDRLPALIKARQEPELAPVQLFFASWGYNDTADEKQAIQQGFSQQSLDTFLS